MNAFLRNVAMLCILRMAVEMLLPAGATRRLCDMTLGLMVMHAMLRAVGALLRGGAA